MLIIVDGYGDDWVLFMFWSELVGMCGKLLLVCDVSWFYLWLDVCDSCCICVEVDDLLVLCVDYVVLILVCGSV